MKKEFLSDMIGLSIMCLLGIAAITIRFAIWLP